MYSNYRGPVQGTYTYPNQYTQDDERFFLAPFLFGGLAGTALGYGIANNNQINNQGYYYYPQPMYYPYPTYIYPSQNTYYFDHM